MALNSAPKFTFDSFGKSCHFNSTRYPSVAVETEVNKNLIMFCNDYPRCNWLIYANTPLSDELKQMIYPTLKQSIQGKSKFEAAGILLNFVQTDFQYKTDNEQFGHERTFFPDELFHYPYSDCEDRAIFVYSVNS